MAKLKKVNMKINSIKVRIFFAILLLGMVPILLVRGLALEFYVDYHVDKLTVEITSQAKLLANQITSSNYIEDTSSPVINAQIKLLSSIYDGRIMVIDDTLTIITDSYGMDERKTITAQEVIRAIKGEEISRYDQEYSYIEMTLPIYETGKSTVNGVMLVSVSSDKILANKLFFQKNIDVVEILLFVIILVLAWLLSRAWIRPFDRVVESIRKEKRGLGTGTINVHGCAEVEWISEACNQLMANMKKLDESRQEFVSNVSHELKTPITSMKVLADSLLDQENVPVELYKEFMTDIAAEIDRESKIINDLLSLVKMDKSSSSLNVTGVNMNVLLEVLMKRLRPIAQQQDVELVLESFRPVTAEIDEVKLSLAFSNLIENAIKYNKQSGWVHVTLNADHQYFYLTIEDSGMGIPEDSLEHIYERFYRVDKSHSRDIGGTGLGLAITRSAILMHRGAIKVHSTVGEGTVFSVRIPLNYIA